ELNLQQTGGMIMQAVLVHWVIKIPFNISDN
ncbi:uncharacterized protein METZ01_LOCUS212868, partial [marine metagenome]